MTWQVYAVIALVALSVMTVPTVFAVDPKTTVKKPIKEFTIEISKGTATNTKCEDKCYTPSKLTVPVDSKVTWKNTDKTMHMASSLKGKFDAGMINSGKSSTVKFDKTGTFDYICTVHPWMKGSIIVKK